MLSRTPPSMLDGEEKPYKYRLETIGHAMSWIKDELTTLKESDKNLMDIFRKLQTDIQEIGEMCNDARHSYRSSRYVPNTQANQDLELSFGDSTEPEDTHVPPNVLPALAMVTKSIPVPQHQLTTSISATDSLSSRSPQHSLKYSPSTNGSGLVASSAASSVSALPISRDSSVDSGIQFVNEPEVATSSSGASLFDEIFSKLGWQQGMAN